MEELVLELLGCLKAMTQTDMGLKSFKIDAP